MRIHNSIIAKTIFKIRMGVGRIILVSSTLAFVPQDPLSAYWSTEFGINGGTALLMDKQISSTVNTAGENLVAYSNNVAKAGGLTGNFYLDDDTKNKLVLPIGLRGEMRFIRNDQWGFGLGGGYQFGAKPKRLVKSGNYSDTLTLTYDLRRWDISGTLYYRLDLAKSGIAPMLINLGLGAGYYQGIIGYQMEDSGNFLTGNYSDKFRASGIGYQALLEVQTSDAPHRLSLGVAFTYVPLKNWKSETAYLVGGDGKPLETSGMQISMYVGYAFATISGKTQKQRNNESPVGERTPP